MADMLMVTILVTIAVLKFYIVCTRTREDY